MMMMMMISRGATLRSDGTGCDEVPLFFSENGRRKMKNEADDAGYISLLFVVGGMLYRFDKLRCARVTTTRVSFSQVFA
jgi:hypothetical protein